jgi:hypothetical protein
LANRFSNGRVQLLAVCLLQGENDETEWLLADIRKIGHRQSADSHKPAEAASRESISPAPPTTVLPGEETIQKALAQKVALHYVNLPLTDALVSLKNKVGVEIKIDTKAMGEVGISTDMPVTFKAANITLRDALKKILPPKDLTWIIRDEVLLITTLDEADGFLVTKVYSVDDLPDADLPTITGPTKDLASSSVISSDAVRAMVVTANWADQEQIAAKLAASREKLRSQTKSKQR